MNGDDAQYVPLDDGTGMVMAERAHECAGCHVAHTLFIVRDGHGLCLGCDAAAHPEELAPRKPAGRSAGGNRRKGAA